MLTKNEIFRIIEEVTGVPQKSVRSVFETYNDLLKNELKREGEVKLPDIGKFKVVVSRKKTAMNPFTGQTIHVQPKAKIKFVPIKAVKETVAKIKWEYVEK